jgi:hypothetical protein
MEMIMVMENMEVENDQTDVGSEIGIRNGNGNDRELKMLQHFINGILSTTLKNQLKATTKTFNDTVQMAIHLEHMFNFHLQYAEQQHSSLN